MKVYLFFWRLILALHASRAYRTTPGVAYGLAPPNSPTPDWSSVKIPLPPFTIHHHIEPSPAGTCEGPRFCGSSERRSHLSNL